MGLSQWFSTQLQASLDGFLWSVEQAPNERRYAPPPGPAGGLGEWVIARHVFHMLYYEREAALPAMRHWLGEAALPSFDEYDEDGAWTRAGDLPELLGEFHAVRTAQIELLPRIDEALWEEQRETGWGNVSLRWIVSKTFQHTAEHTNDVLRITLFWDHIEEYNRERAAQAASPPEGSL